ncbi:hypothetical protein QNO07_10455 [Streptomyces sp. 549]|nr:hypothetical protein [Streptomyces sp. 549]MDK1473836.1 hypothetical protein [Streptomyces sp. 549]
MLGPLAITFGVLGLLNKVNQGTSTIWLLVGLVLTGHLLLLFGGASP